MFGCMIKTDHSIQEAIDAFQADLEAHPECRADLRDRAVLRGEPRRHPVFSLGRFPDLERGEDLQAPPPPEETPEERLLRWIRGASAPLKLLNPIQPARRVGKGPGTMAASFGIFLNPEIGFTPQGARDLDEVIREGIPSVDSRDRPRRLDLDIAGRRAGLRPLEVRVGD
jgi:hypothetical protein